MKPLIIIFVAIMVSACTAVQADEPVLTEPLPTEPASPTPLEQNTPTIIPAPVEEKFADLPDLGAAPELENQVWLNTDGALRLADLRGNVVLLDMWTFG